MPSGFNRRAALDDDWVLMDLLPESTGGGRGMYTGRISPATAGWPATSPRSRCSGLVPVGAGRLPSEPSRRKVYSRIVQNESGRRACRPSAPLPAE